MFFNINIKLSVGAHVETSRVLTGIVLVAAFGTSIARLVRGLLHFRLVFRDSDGNIVDCHLVRLRCAAVDIFQTRRMPVLTSQLVLPVLVLDATGRATAAAPFLFTWLQKRHILLLCNLKCEKISICTLIFSCVQ